jgi:hypothetical protein
MQINANERIRKIKKPINTLRSLNFNGFGTDLHVKQAVQI